MRTAKIEIRATEFPQFARLVQYLSDVTDWAEANWQPEVLNMSQACIEDLKGMYTESWLRPQD